MNDSSMKFSINKDLDVRSNSFDAFISYMENSSDLWAIKNVESRFVYVNDIAMQYNGLPKNFNIEGKLDSECPAPWSEFSELIQETDKSVMDKQRPIPVLNTFVYGGRNKLVQPFMVEVTPLIREGRSIGVVVRGKKLEIFSMYHLEKTKFPETLSFGNPSNLFTDREFDVVFFAMQSLSRKEIAKRLDISPNTVEKYLNKIYEKTGVSALSQLIDYCRNNGYDKYAPNKFINPVPYIPLA